MKGEKGYKLVEGQDEYSIFKDRQIFTTPGRVPETVVRIVTENCSTLQFDDFGFEEE